MEEMIETIETTTFEFNQDELGEAQVEWEVDEYPQYHRSRLWYVIAMSLSVGLIIYSVITANFLFAIIILMCGVIMLVSTFTRPSRVPVVITTTGVIVSDIYYDFDSIRNFSLAYDPPEVKILYLDFYAITHPLISIPLEDVDPNIVRECLIPFCNEDLSRSREGLTDKIKRLYKL